MKKFLGIIILLFSLLGLLIALKLVKERQELQKKAVVVGGVGKISLSPQTLTLTPGTQFTTTINFRTGDNESDAKTISSISLRLTLPYNSNQPELEVVDQEGNLTTQISPNLDLTSSGEWLFPIKSVTRDNSTLTIDLAAINVNPTGYKATTDVPLATINFKALNLTQNPLTTNFDVTESKMLTKTDPPEDILDVPANATYTIANPTSTPNPTEPPTPTPTMDPSQTPTPTSTLQATTTPTPPDNIVSCNGVTVEGYIDTSVNTYGETVYIVTNGGRLSLTAHVQGQGRVVWTVPGYVVGYSDSVGSFDYSPDPINYLSVYYTTNNTTQNNQSYYIDATVESIEGGSVGSTKCPTTRLTVLPTSLTATPTPEATNTPILEATSTPVPQPTNTPPPGTTATPTPVSQKIGDTVGAFDANDNPIPDGVVDEADYAAVIAYFGTTGTPGTVIGDTVGAFDANDNPIPDGVVDEADYAAVIAYFGK